MSCTKLLSTFSTKQNIGRVVIGASEVVLSLLIATAARSKSLERSALNKLSRGAYNEVTQAEYNQLLRYFEVRGLEPGENLTPSSIGIGSARGNPEFDLLSNTFTVSEALQIQRIANKYGIRIGIGGSRGKGAGRNIERSDLPAGKGEGTRSDIDFIVDPTHPRFAEIFAELKQVGGGAGGMHPDAAFLSSHPDPSVIFFTPK